MSRVDLTSASLRHGDNEERLDPNSAGIDRENRLLPIFRKLSNREDLVMSESQAAASTILNGLASNRPGTNELLVAFFGGLTIKDATVEELVGMAMAMEATKRFRFRFNVNKPLVTAGGTGGDTIPTINVTTPARALHALVEEEKVKSVYGAARSILPKKQILTTSVESGVARLI